MGKKGTQCCGFGCNKRKKKKGEGENRRSDSDGSEDEETHLKRQFPRTFHAFPSDPARKAQWIASIQRKTWQPSKYSRICSDHFKESDINRTGQIVQLRDEAVPTRFKQIPKRLKEGSRNIKGPLKRCSETPTPSCPPPAPPPADEPAPKKACESPVAAGDHIYQMMESPRKFKAKLERSSKQILRLRKELKTFQQKSRRLKLSVTSLKLIVKQLKKKIQTSSNLEGEVKLSDVPSKVNKRKTSVDTEMEMQLPPHEGDVLSVVDMHTGGEPLRIILSGYPQVEGGTVLSKRRYVQDRLDHLRRVLMLEPRGHYDMYGALVVDSELPEADLAVLFMHNEGYSTMCGHAVIALGRFAVDYKLVKDPRAPETQVNIHCPCGLVRAFVEYSEGKTGGVRFLSVPAFAFATDVTVTVEGFGEVTVDISYGGAFYAFVDAQRFGLDVTESKTRELVDAATAVTDAVKSQVQLHHPTSDDLAFLYGTILTDGKDVYSSEPTANVCVFAMAQVDRSPTGSGVTARVALQYHKGLIRLNQTRTFQSGAIGSQFTGKAVEETQCGDFRAVVVEVAGRAFYSGVSRFVQEPEDQLTHGFLLR